jgi:hypothetical protein
MYIKFIKNRHIIFCSIVYVTNLFFNPIIAKQRSFVGTAMTTITQAIVNYKLSAQLDHATLVLENIEAAHGFYCENFKGNAHSFLFTYPEVVNCLQNIEITGSLDPLFSLWHTTHFFVSHFFLQEYAVLLFLTYRNLLKSFEFDLFEFRGRNDRAISLPDLLEKTTYIYGKIESLPLKEILEMINLLAIEIPKILEEHMI